MKTYKGFLKNAFSTAALIVSITLGAHAQNGGQLYLVTGYAASNAFPSPNADSSLLAVSEAQSSVVRVANLVENSESDTFILADHERRVLAVGIGGGVADTQRVVLIDMDAPTRPRTIATSFTANFFCSPNVGLLEACNVDELSPERRLSSIRLTDSSGSSNNKARQLGWEAYRTARTEGFWAPSDMHPYLDLAVSGQNLRFLSTVATPDLGVPKPPTLEANDKDRLILAISNDEMFVIGRYGAPTSSGPGTTETHKYFIYDKKAGTWQDFSVSGAGYSIRAFGSWIVTAGSERKRPFGANRPNPNEPQSPGSKFRERVINQKSSTRQQIHLEDLFQYVPVTFSGDLSLYNTGSKRMYTIHTGQGDSEILLVDGNTVYYRVNDSLYRAQIGQSQIEKAQLLAQDDSIQLAHWALLGPVLTQ